MNRGLDPSKVYRPHLLRWQLRQLRVINGLAVAAVVALVLFRSEPLIPVGGLIWLLAISVHSGLMVWKVGATTAGNTGFLYSQGFSRDQVWWQTLLATMLSAILVCGFAWILIATRIRSAVQDQLFANKYFPFIAPDETVTPCLWLCGYLIVLPLMHFMWIKANQPQRGGAGSGWILMVTGLYFLAWSFDRIPTKEHPTRFLFYIACLFLPAAAMLTFACLRLHRSMEVRS